MGTGNRSTDVSAPYDPQFECCAGILGALVKAHGESIALIMVDACVARAINGGYMPAIQQMMKLGGEVAVDDVRIKFASSRERHSARRLA